MKKQALGRNSAENIVSLVRGISDDIPLPDGVILRDEAEMVIWRQFTRARARDGWRDFDLLLVAKAVRLEADIRKHQAMLDRTGPIIKNERGTPVQNPMFNVVDSLQRQQLSIIRSISLNQTERDPRTLNGAGTAQAQARRTFNNDDSLFATP